jgi:hypothetical protein
MNAQCSTHVYEVRPRKIHRGVDVISDVLPFGRLWYGEPDAVSNAIDNAKFYSRSHHAVIRVYEEAGNVTWPRVLTRRVSHYRPVVASMPLVVTPALPNVISRP